MGNISKQMPELYDPTQVGSSGRLQCNSAAQLQCFDAFIKSRVLRLARFLTRTVAGQRRQTPQSRKYSSTHLWLSKRSCNCPALLVYR